MLNDTLQLGAADSNIHLAADLGAATSISGGLPVRRWKVAVVEPVESGQHSAAAHFLPPQTNGPWTEEGACRCLARFPVSADSMYGLHRLNVWVAQNEN